MRMMIVLAQNPGSPNDTLKCLMLHQLLTSHSVLTVPLQQSQPENLKIHLGVCIYKNELSIVF